MAPTMTLSEALQHLTDDEYSDLANGIQNGCSRSASLDSDDCPYCQIRLNLFRIRREGMTATSSANGTEEQSPDLSIEI